MASVLANGFGTVTGTRLAPNTLYDHSVSGEETIPNFVSITNTDTANWLFVKSADTPGPYVVALPGATVTVARGPGGANNLHKIVGFAATPSEAGTASILAVISAIKVA